MRPDLVGMSAGRLIRLPGLVDENVEKRVIIR
jgi:hypothetical protein